MFNLTDQVAVITGSASGIGAATARRLATAGAHVVLASFSPDGHDIDAVRSSVEALGRKALVVETDVSDTQSVDALIATSLRHFGRLDVAIANAAIARRRASVELDDAEWGRTINIDLHGVWRVFRAALPPMMKAKYGRLIATASTAGALEAWDEHIHYSAAKSGIVGIVKSLAAEAGPSGITVNAIAPGIIETPQTLDSTNSLGQAGIHRTAETQPVRRIGRPEDIAAGFHFLASPDASFVTGHLLLIDGGRMLIRS